MPDRVRDFLFNWKLACSVATAGVWYAVALALLWVWQDGIAVLSLLVGTSAGWATGALLAPYPEEESRFRKLSKGLTAFIGGFVVGKVDRVFELVTDAKSGPPLILNPVFARNIWMALGCFFTSTLIVFITRAYVPSVTHQVAKDQSRTSKTP